MLERVEEHEKKHSVGWRTMTGPSLYSSQTLVVGPIVWKFFMCFPLELETQLST
jgi:hypothetical protein